MSASPSLRTKKRRMKKSDLSRVLEQLESAPFFKHAVTQVKTLPAEPGEFREFPPELAAPLQEVLKARGISKLYSHQEEALRRARAGENLVIVTPTASGKTLCYNLPVLNAVLEDESIRALYIFPTKALAQDQYAEIQGLIDGMGTHCTAYTYDGDTPGDIRPVIRKRAQIVITNPDMLHTAILPHHTKWSQFFARLAFVVVDEMHSYRGVFGSHMVHVLARLLRVCGHYGSSPQFLFSSATIANPEELAAKLAGKPVSLIRQNGAPRAEKRFYFLNPPVVRPELGLRQSAQSLVQKIAVPLLRKGISTIVFATSRLAVEVLTRYLKEGVAKARPKSEDKIRGYRGGYLPNQRREIERGLREGRITGVVSTNALELGVDIGSLEVSILCGYPGSIASTWQQAGRAGRRAGLSAAMLVARSTPLDQFIVRNPQYFFGLSPERARLNPENLSILVSHIKCAAFELPFRRGENFGGKELEAILDYLVERRILTRTGDRWYWADVAYPANQVSLRTIQAENFTVLDRSAGNRVIAEVDFESAPRSIYPGAVYMVEGVPYTVEDLDFKGRKAYVRPGALDYYTEAICYTHLRILDVFSSAGENRGGPEFFEGEVHVVDHAAGFKKLKFYTLENLGYGEICLPDQEMHTSAFWIRVPEESFSLIGLSLQDLLQALAGVGYAIRHMASFLLMCESRDLGMCIGDPGVNWFLREPCPQGTGRAQAAWAQVSDLDLKGFQPSLFLYDAYPGGVGLATTLFGLRQELLLGTRSMIEGCSCRHGCPSCVGPYTEIGEGAKEFATKVLTWMISGRG